MKHKSISERSLLQDTNSMGHSRSVWKNNTRLADEAVDLKFQYAIQNTLPVEFILASSY